VGWKKMKKKKTDILLVCDKGSLLVLAGLMAVIMSPTYG
jgi:hypothetical protein